MSWLAENWIEVFGAVTGILFVFLEIRQNLLLWPVGFLTSAVYIWVFFNGKLYADASLQVYYLTISLYGWYWWIKGGKSEKVRAVRQGNDQTETGELSDTANSGWVINDNFSQAGDKQEKDEKRSAVRSLPVTRISLYHAMVLSALFLLLWLAMYIVLRHLTDSPVPAADSFVTSLSVIATWMLARKIYEHWYLWIVVNMVSAILFLTRDLYATVVLYSVYCVMSFAGLYEWRRSMRNESG